MATIRFAVPVLALAALLTPAAAGHTGAPRATAVAIPAASRWGRAFGVPGLGALTAGGSAQVSSVSCASAGNCAAGGVYADSSGRGQGFVVSERRGVWRRAFEVPGLGALNARGAAEVKSVSCASAGNCGAGGIYSPDHIDALGFVVSQRRGVWGRAIEVPGLSALTAGQAQVSSVSCASAGNCAAGGVYVDRSGHARGFVVSERSGVWRRAIEVPGLGALAAVNSVSCGSAGNCAAGGINGNLRGFVVSERSGV